MWRSSIARKRGRPPKVCGNVVHAPKHGHCSLIKEHLKFPGGHAGGDTHSAPAAGPHRLPAAICVAEPQARTAAGICPRSSAWMRALRYERRGQTFKSSRGHAYGQTSTRMRRPLRGQVDGHPRKTVTQTSGGLHSRSAAGFGGIAQRQSTWLASRASQVQILLPPPARRGPIDALRTTAIGGRRTSPGGLLRAPPVRPSLPRR